jgi:hypothetical protein
MVTPVEFVAVTVRLVELPAVIVGELAVKVTTGRAAGVTVTAVVAEIFPPPPVAVAVYVVVAVGLTDCAPPFEARVYELPSVPVTATAVALVAVTVSVEELPEVIDVGLAAILTVGAGLVTVTVAPAETFPPVPVAVAVYVVVAVGLTDCVPPVDVRVYELPSLPVIVTPVALVAVTVSVDDPPAVIEVGLAAILTVGAGLVDAPTVTVVDAEIFPPAPVAVAV